MVFGWTIATAVCAGLFLTGKIEDTSPFCFFLGYVLGMVIFTFFEAAILPVLGIMLIAATIELYLLKKSIWEKGTRRKTSTMKK